MRYIYLSPHLDDAVLSCGGMIWEQVQQRNSVEVWTFFTSDPPAGPLSPFAKMLHARWNETQNPYLTRRQEDQRANDLLGCKWAHLDFADCIYRNDPKTGAPIIQVADDLFSPDYKPETHLLDRMVKELQARQLNDAHLVVPLGVGRHIDHQITRLAAEKLGRMLHYYSDFPYAAQDPDQIKTLVPKSAEAVHFEISPGGLSAWQDAIACYESQISSFWTSIDEMKKAVAEYASQPLTCILWKKQTIKNSRSSHGQT